MEAHCHHDHGHSLHSPLGPRDIVLGEVIWCATRAVASATAVLVVATAFGLIASPLAVLALPCAFLIGLVFASMAMVLTAAATTIGAMNNFFTLFILPMFYVSGVFFPLERLPDAVQTASWALPLTPGAALVRGLVTGEPSWPTAAVTSCFRANPCRCINAVKLSAAATG